MDNAIQAFILETCGFGVQLACRKSFFPYLLLVRNSISMIAPTL